MTEITSKLSTALADRYKIERHLGEGGMATVYLAEDLKHKRKVAVKVLRPELAAVLGAERFVQEITTTANLQHPHILPLFDSGEADGFLYYVMPYIEGETLRDKLNRESQLSIDEAVKITTEVADALDYAHRASVIHRDIKPENILLHDGRAMVADFGIALAVSAAAGGRMTETGLSLGTPHYMSPEQATAEKDLTNRSDIYSLGTVLYELLAGAPPHLGGSAQQIIMKIVTDEARPITELRKSVPPHVAAATTKSLEKLAADRFESAAKFAEALTNPAFTLPTAASAKRGVPVNAPGKPRLAWSFAAAATVVAAVSIWGWARTASQPEDRVFRVRVALPSEETIQEQSGSLFDLSDDGSRAIYTGLGAGDVELWIRDFDQLHARNLPATNGADSPFLSGDGSTVAYYRANPNALHIATLEGGPPSILVRDSLLALGGDFAANGTVYFVRAGGIRRISREVGTIETVTTVDKTAGEVSHGWPHVLPNGRGALFTIARRGQESDIAAVDFETDKTSILVRGTTPHYSRTGHLVYVREDNGTLLAIQLDQDELTVTGSPTAIADGITVAGGVARFALSANGTLLYQRGGSEGGDGLVWVDRDGRESDVEPGWTENFQTLAVSPDGMSIAVSIQTADGQHDVWIKRLDTGTLTKLSLDGSINYRPFWAPDGQRVGFSSNRGGEYTLFSKRADGAGSAESLLDHVSAVQEGLWSNEGRWLVFRASGGESRDIFGIQLGRDSAPVALVASEFHENSATLSPDGRWLAYTSNESGRPEVYVVPFPNTGDSRWLVSRNGGLEPLWAHSGRELFYRDGEEQLIAVAVETSPTFSAGAQHVLFSTGAYERNFTQRGYDVSPDDQRFLMIRERAVSEGELIVVRNLHEELKAKVGN